MRTRVLWLLTVASYAVALWQRPGKTVSDTRLELSLDPGLFLSRVTHLWSGTTDLGHVQSGQFNGYLFPMGPWFAGGDALGLPMWLVQRLWLGTLLALAAWGVVRLLDELLEPSARRPVAQLAAGLLFVFNPYVVQFTSRGTVAFIAYAALPWLMVAAHRGARAPRGWRWPAAVALVLAASGGGVNAALIAFMLLGPVGLLAYDAWTGALRWRAIGSFAWRAGLLGALASAWWAIPVLLQSGYGADFLSFTEQPGTIWATTSLSEGVRELGFWGMYVGSGFGHQLPFISTAHYYLFNPAVLVGSFSVPVLAVAGLRLARSWRYAPFFGLLAVVSLVVMAAGYPEGTPMRHALDFLYGNVPAGRFLRTTYKAAPVLILAFACLGGAATAAIVERLRAARGGAGDRPLGARPRLLSFRPARAAAFAALLLPLLAGAPLLLGTAIDSHQEYSVPAAWPRALDDATAAAGPDGRTAMMPGEIFGMYRWGATMDPAAPGLERRPVAIREVVPYADQRSAQLQTAVDDLVQQDRLAPGQLGPLLKLMGVRQLVVATDSRRHRSGALDPVGAAVALAREPELRRSTEHYGYVHLFKPKFGRSGPRLELPELRRYALPPGPGMVRVQPDAGATVLDGDAAGVTALAGVGALDPSRSLFYSPDVAAPVLRRLVAGGARLVLTDSNRRRAYVASRTRLNTGPTLTETAPIKSDFSRYTPFGDRPTAATTAAYSTLSRLYAPALPAFNQFPERRAYAVFDGRRDTTWISDPVLDPPKRYVQATLRRPLHAPWVEVFPHVDRLGGTTRVELTFNGGHKREVAVSPSGTRVPVPVPELRTLRVRIAKTHHTGRKPVAGGLDEVRIPGLRVNEWLRLPTDLATAAHGLDLARNELDVVLERTTADFPRRTGRRVGAVQDVNPLDAVDPEPSIQRQVDLPAARAFSVSGWASVSPTAPDDAIDRLAGVPAAWRMTSSSRFEGVPGRRASSAFDGDPRTAWVGDLAGRPWIAWRSPRPLTVRRLLIGSGPSDYERPAVVRVRAGGASRTAPVGKSGRVALGAPLRGRSFRVDIVATTHGARLPGVAIGELRVPALHAPSPRRRGGFRTGCGALGMRAVGARTAPLAVSGSLRALDDGDSLRLASCGGPLRLPAGSTLIGSPAGVALRADRVLLRSPAPAPLAVAAAPAGRVLSVSGEGPLGVPDRARISVQRPGWLVLGQSWSRGWRASCRDASGKTSDLGEPLPIDGFANGWRVQPGCVEATFSFPPQRAAIAGYALSALAFLVCLVIALVGWRRSRRRRPAAVAVAAGLPDAALRLDWRRALALAVAVGVIGGFVFAIRAGAVLAPLTFLAAWRGIDARRLTILALAAIGLLPLIYLVFQPKNRGGFAFSYANDLLGAHWVAAFAVACIAAASLLMARAWRAAGASALDGADHAVPGGDLAQQRDPHEEREPRPVARLHVDDA